MTIQFTTRAPVDIHAKLDGWVSDIQDPSLAIVDGEGTVLNVRDSYVYKVKYLSVTKIASRELVNAIHTSRWRSLVMSGQHVYGELELDDAYEPIALYKGTSKDGLQEALGLTKNVEDNDNHEYEACVLTSPPLRFIGLWLHSESKDWLIPYPFNATALENYKPVTINEALAVLQPRAEEVLKYSEKLSEIDELISG